MLLLKPAGDIAGNALPAGLGNQPMSMIRVATIFGVGIASSDFFIDGGGGYMIVGARYYQHRLSHFAVINLAGLIPVKQPETNFEGGTAAS